MIDGLHHDANALTKHRDDLHSNQKIQRIDVGKPSKILPNYQYLDAQKNDVPSLVGVIFFDYNPVFEFAQFWVKMDSLHWF